MMESSKSEHFSTVAKLVRLSLPHPLLTLHHHSSQYPVDSRLVTRTLGLQPVDHFGIHAQRNPLLPWTVPARLCTPLLLRQRQQIIFNRGTQLNPFPGRPFRRFAFLVLAVMTESYACYRHDVMFLVEHFLRMRREPSASPRKLEDASARCPRCWVAHRSHRIVLSSGSSHP
jgi:hypothetical protein